MSIYGFFLTVVFLYAIYYFNFFDNSLFRISNEFYINSYQYNNKERNFYQFTCLYN